MRENGRIIKKSFVDEKNGTCVVEYGFTGRDNPLIYEVEEKCSKNTKSLFNLLNSKYLRRAIEPIESTKGVAKLDSRDDFSKKKGIDVADLKASYKYHKAARKKYGKFIAILRKAISEIEEIENYHYNKCLNIEADYNRYYLEGQGDTKYDAVIPTRKFD